MKTATLATAATFLAASSAATVKLETTSCIDQSVPYGQQFDIELNAGVVPKDLPQVCGLKIVSATDSVDVNSITCQAFRDAQGTQTGSAKFTYASPALIATNPVVEKAIKCSFDPAAPSSYVLAARQLNNTVSSLQASASAVLSSTPVVTLTSTVTPSANSDASTIVRTTVVDPSSAFPSPSANGTVSSGTPTPSSSATRSPSPSSSTVPGAAGKVSVGMGVVLGAVVAMFV